MAGKTIETSPQPYARTAGAIYLCIIVLGIFSQMTAMDAVVVPGDPAATARNISASMTLWNLGVAGGLIIPIIGVVQLWIEYLLLRPVGRNTALLFLAFNIASLSVEAASKIFLLIVAPAVGGGGFSHPLPLADQEMFVRLALNLHLAAFNVSLVFFGCACLVNGWLVFRSGYLPRTVGVLMQLAGVAYLVACFAAMFAPVVANILSPGILVVPLVGEGSMCLWLLIFGVNVPRWKARIAAAA
ncbi:DUF4386 domain-containing protein [Phenylobacterium aquaticum]|uniref:DUF4386 domain-containing protein n=1 Tax=Phenylobacterium aquaticum TaxID=1763816 RepID=UPI0026F271EC|nr:DUF4386 domain-containing protein [Phenylobacterium aquaticum]